MEKNIVKIAIKHENNDGKKEYKQLTEEEFLLKLNRLKEATKEMDAVINSGTHCWDD